MKYKSTLLLLPIILLHCNSPKTSTNQQPRPSDAKKPDFEFFQTKLKKLAPVPPYPEDAKAIGIQGTVVVKIVVGKDGLPIKATAISGPKELRNVAEKMAINCEFYPAVLNGEPQVSMFKLSLPFKLY